MFPQSRIRELMTKYELVQLYTDRVPPQYEPTTSAEENRKFQEEKFGDLRLPLYVIVRPLGGGKWEEVGRYEEGKINDVAGFAEFLAKPLR